MIMNGQSSQKEGNFDWIVDYNCLSSLLVDALTTSPCDHKDMTVLVVGCGELILEEERQINSYCMFRCE